MADLDVPMDRVGVVRLVIVDKAAAVTEREMANIDWSITGGGASYFSLVVSGDGLTGEIHPIAIGNGSITVSANPGPGFSGPTSTRTISIVAAVGDNTPSGELPYFIGTELTVVPEVGRLG